MDKTMKPHYPIWVWVLLVSLILLVNVATAADPWENYVPSSVNGTAPYTVTLVSISYNEPTAWNWSFKDVTGNNTEIWFSQTENTTITFHYGGNYSIRLNSSNTDGYNITPWLVFVNVTGPTAPEPTPTPTPIPTATPFSPTAMVGNVDNQIVIGMMMLLLVPLVLVAGFILLLLNGKGRSVDPGLLIAGVFVIVLVIVVFMIMYIANG
jgi:PKD repeat protein